MSRSGLQTGGSVGRRSKMYRDLPNGGFQTVNASITSQERCRVPPPGTITDAMLALGGLGQQDVHSEMRGIEDVEAQDSIIETGQTDQTDQNHDGQEVQRDDDVTGNPFVSSSNGGNVEVPLTERHGSNESVSDDSIAFVDT